MSSKASAPGRSGHARQFVKDWKRPLPPEFFDHPLRGEWADHRDCHIRGDWLLIYRINATPQGEEIVFVRTGTHAELFD
jgi:mRNA interferase YafQ